jgi:D-alanyl-D-alanine carboxypeptidase
VRSVGNPLKLCARFYILGALPSIQSLFIHEEKMTSAYLKFASSLELKTNQKTEYRHQKRMQIASAVTCALACFSFSQAAFAADEKVALPSVKSIRGECENILNGAPVNGPGTVVLVARRGELVCSAARGMADVELNVALRPEHRFRIASLSKQFTAVALLKLVDQGLAKLDDPISKYQNDFPNGANISLLQLLNHTSGVASITDLPGFENGDLRKDMSSKELMKLTTDLPPNFAPGTAWRYSDSGYIVLSAVIEKITGKSWDKALDELLFKPLNLKDTAYENPDDIAAGLVRGYRKDKQGKISPASPISMTVPQGAGALISSAKDLWRWNEALHGGRVLSPVMYQQMTTAQGAAVKDKYGFGILNMPVRGQAALWHNGEINGFVSELYYLPESGTTVVQLDNMDARAKPYALKLAATAIGVPFANLSLEKWTPEQLASAQGEYTKDGASRTLKLRDGKLYSQKQSGRALALSTAKQEKLAFDDDELSSIQLQRDDKKQVVAMHFYARGSNKPEIWTRKGDLPKEAAPMAIAEEQITRVLGSYTSPRFSIEVRRSGKAGLEVQAKGQPNIELILVAPNKFKLSVVEATLEFDASGSQAGSVILNQGPNVITLKRE